MKFSFNRLKDQGIFHLEKNGGLVLVALWIIVQAFVYFHFGVKEAVDSSMYIEDAQYILNGSLPTGRSFWYSGYSFFLACIFYFNGGIREVVLAQILISALATYSIYLLAVNITGERLTGIVAGILYLCWIKIHEWNTIVYSDSLFTNATVITLAALHFSRRPLSYIGVTVLIIYTFLTRPTGIAFLTGIAAYLFFKNAPKLKYSWPALIIAGICITTVVLMLLNKVLQSYVPSLVQSYANAEIIYPGITLGLDKPQDLTLPATHYPPLLQLLLFFIHNPIYYFKISLFKMVLFLGNVKPYFSLLHNLVIVLFLYPVYGLAVLGYKKADRNELKAFMLVFILFQVLTVGLTSENWDGRFLVPVLPYVFILAAVGITGLLSKRIV